MMLALLKKDFRNACASIGPAIMLGIPMLLIIEFTQSSTSTVSWRSAFWLTYFFGSTALYFRSFGLENRFKNFHFYTAFKISRLKIFLSQAIIQFLAAFLMGCFYLLMTVFFFSPTDLDARHFVELIALTSLTLAPIGTVLGLMLQLEREFLFSIVYLPLATPVILASFSLSLGLEGSWLYVLLSFLVGGAFLSAAIFEFFFDDLSA
ncbi:MAG: hypothetical protein J0M01_08405 [Dechloromonas sp.]|nr:hypothetical protein [Dechloromonas sp.]MBN8555670.1 hypothetical protein [Deltaproteobacteria bacterium]